MWEKNTCFFYLMVYLGNIFLNYSEFYFKTKKLIFNTWKPRLHWLTGRCNLSCAQKQPPTWNKLNSIRAARQLLWKMHEFIHTYFLQKEIRSQLRISTKTYVRWHAGQILHFLFPVGGIWKKKNNNQENPGIMFIFSSILNCQPVNTLSNIFEMRTNKYPH